MFEDYADVAPPEVVREEKWRLFSLGCLSSVLPGAGQILRDLRTRGYFWIGVFLFFLIASTSAQPWHSPDGRLPTFIIGAVVLVAAGIDAAFAQTEEIFRPAVWLILAFAPMAFISSRTATPIVWRSYGYRSYRGTFPDMQPTVMPGDQVVVDSRAYLHHVPDRGDVVVTEELRLDATNNLAHLLRIIAIPGDTIQGTNGQITLNNVAIRESYVPASSVSIDVSASSDEQLKKRFTFGPVRLGPYEYFVMGDDREFSSDSRLNGPIKLDKILGKALYIVSSDSSRDGKRLE